MSAIELVDGLDGLKSFLALHYAQLKASGIPDIYWATLHSKLTHSNFDAGDSFSIAELDDDVTLTNSTFNRWKVMVTRPGGVSVADPEHVYLIDHAWTFRPDQVKSQLFNIPGLLARMCALMGVTYHEDIDTEAAVKEVMTCMWKYSQSYSIGNQNLEAEERLPIWYIMDEFGYSLFIHLSVDDYEHVFIQSDDFGKKSKVIQIQIQSHPKPSKSKVIQIQSQSNPNPKSSKVIQSQSKSSLDSTSKVIYALKVITITT